MYIVFIFAKKRMKYEDILGGGKLWAVKYDGHERNCFDELFDFWYDMEALRTFFKENLADLSSYFKITNIDIAIFDTMQDADYLSCLMLDIKPGANLDNIFRHFENFRYSEMVLGREKAKGGRINSHPSWLRVYAIRMEPGVYLVTGGAIKLTATMEERKHTLDELQKIEKVRNQLISDGIFDADALKY